LKIDRFHLRDMKPGKYNVTFECATEAEPGGKYWTGRAVSNPVEIEILPGEVAATALSGKITFVKLRAPKQPDLVEQINLADGATKQIVQASVERPSIRSFCFSPDRKQFLFEKGAGDNWYENNEIYLGSSSGDGVRRLTNNNLYDGDPAWSVDGTKVAFTRGWGVNGGVHLLELASGQERSLPTPGLVITRQPRCLDDSLLVVARNAEKSWGLAELDLEKNGVRQIFKGQVDYLSLSPDRKRLACVVQEKNALQSMEEPDFSYSVRILDLASAQFQTLDAPQSVFEKDICPRWSPDGKKLAWVRNHRKDRTCKLLVYDIGTERLRTIASSDDEGVGAGSIIIWAPDGGRLAHVTCDPERQKYNLQVHVLSTGATKTVFTTPDEIQCLYWE
jgi:Tol biopolymer transport system component